MMKETKQCPLLCHNTFGIDVTAKSFIEYDTADDLSVALSHISHFYAEQPLLHIGEGSNLLFLKDFSGVVLHSRINSIEEISATESEILLRVGAGMNWDSFVAYCVDRGLAGIENLSLIPGQVGACAVQNIGAYGAEAKDVIVKVECVDLKTGNYHSFSHEECNYGYRKSIFKEQYAGRFAVTYVTFKLYRHFRPNIEYGGIHKELQRRGVLLDQLTVADVRNTVIAIRKEKLPDPHQLGNAGSFFMNPIVERSVFETLAIRYPNMPYYEQGDGNIKIPAGWMIDQCGWKGKSLGPAGVHDKQALVLVNLGGATGADVQALSNAVCKSVKEKFGVDIKPEVNFIG